METTHNEVKEETASKQDFQLRFIQAPRLIYQPSMVRGALGSRHFDLNLDISEA